MKIFLDETHPKIKTLYGCPSDFPSDGFRKFSKTDMLLESAMLKEGLTRTYPYEWVCQYLVNHVNSDFYSIEGDDDDKQILVKLKPGSRTIEALKNTMNSFGYFSAFERDSAVYAGGFNMMPATAVRFEPKFDEFMMGSEFGRDGRGITFYHVTPVRYIQKIAKYGLEPKSKNTFLDFPERVHLILADEGQYCAETMAAMLNAKSDVHRDDDKYAMFGVTTDGLENVKFYRDRNVPDFYAFFTYENIPPKNLKFMHTFSPDAF